MSSEPMKITDRRAALVSDEPQEPMSLATSPVDILLGAIQRTPNMDLVKLEKLMELAERWQAAQARRSYVAAFAKFKKNMPDVVKDLLNTQYGSDYSSLANLVNTTNRVLGEYDLNANWRPKQSAAGIEITCVVTHAEGHSEEVTLVGPPDVSGTMNPLQRIKSTMTYLEGATFQAITGVVARSKVLNPDDDGNGAGKDKPEDPPLPEGYANWVADMRAYVDTGCDLKQLQETWGKSDAEYRRYVVKYDEAWWITAKNKAKKATP